MPISFFFNHQQFFQNIDQWSIIFVKGLARQQGHRLWQLKIQRQGFCAPFPSYSNFLVTFAVSTPELSGLFTCMDRAGKCCSPFFFGIFPVGALDRLRNVSNKCCLCGPGLRAIKAKLSCEVIWVNCSNKSGACFSFAWGQKKIKSMGNGFGSSQLSMKVQWRSRQCMGSDSDSVDSDSVRGNRIRILVPNPNLLVSGFWQCLPP